MEQVWFLVSIMSLAQAVYALSHYIPLFLSPIKYVSCHNVWKINKWTYLIGKKHMKDNKINTLICLVKWHRRYTNTDLIWDQCRQWAWSLGTVAQSTIWGGGIMKKYVKQIIPYLTLLEPHSSLSSRAYHVLLRHYPRLPKAWTRLCTFCVKDGNTGVVAKTCSTSLWCGLLQTGSQSDWQFNDGHSPSPQMRNSSTGLAHPARVWARRREGYLCNTWWCLLDTRALAGKE